MWCFYRSEGNSELLTVTCMMLAGEQQGDEEEERQLVHQSDGAEAVHDEDELMAVCVQVPWM